MSNPNIKIDPTKKYQIVKPAEIGLQDELLGKIITITGSINETWVQQHSCSLYLFVAEDNPIGNVEYVICDWNLEDGDIIEVVDER